LKKDDPLIGQQLANFHIERLLGRGGMARVYYGRDVKLHRPVAIKVIEPSYRANPSYSQRFIKEARVMAKWRHENIVQIHYADDAGGFYYYVMEYVDGKDLASILSKYSGAGDLMPADDVLRIGYAVARALDYAHQQNVIHRDVKPANIMIARDGRVVLGDFGLALEAQDKSQGEAFGTPHYISPEQARRSADAVPQSDLYSLGVILYEMLTGTVPFNDPSPASLALQHITQAPPLPRSINPELSQGVEDVLLKALEKDPRKRYQSGEALMDALKTALSARPAAAGKIPLPPIPVDTPTIRRSAVSIDEFAKQKDRKPSRRDAKRPPANGRKPPRPAPGEQKPGSEFSWFISSVVFVLVVIAVLGWLIGSRFFDGSAQPTPVLPVLEITAPAPTDSRVPVSPSANSPVSPTATRTSAPSATFVPLPTATETVPSTATGAVDMPIAAPPTVRYPNGNLFTLFYNESSLYLYNRSTESRSLSGFNFERINDDGTFGNHFGGWQWETFFNESQPDRCVRAEIYLAYIETPYLNPEACLNRYHSTLQPFEGADTIFWTLKDDSRQFRVLWQETEVARCEISAGICDFRVP